MPSKKKKYNARFPAGRIKKIMQSDEEVGKVAQAVPIIISRTLELFVKSMLEKTLRITNARNAKTLSPSHMKQCIMSENRFDFLRELVKNVPDINVHEEQLAADDEPLSPTSPPLPAPPLLPPQLPAASYLDPNEPINLSISNGSNSSRSTHSSRKRSVDATDTDRPWKMNKQHSLDAAAVNLTSNSQSFYNSNSSGSSCSNASGTNTAEPILNFTINYPSSGGQVKVDVGRPSKPTSNPLMSIASTALTAGNQPIINFDFTKASLASTSTACLPTPNIMINSSHMKAGPAIPTKPPIPELLKIGPVGVAPPIRPAATSTTSNINHSVESLLQRPMRKISTRIEPLHPRIPQPKFHHSHALHQHQHPHHHQPQMKHLPSSSSSTISRAAITAAAMASMSIPKSTVNHPQTPVINININHATTTPMISYSIPSTTTKTNSNSLEMDEDYDNI